MRQAAQLMAWFWWRHKVMLVLGFASVVVGQLCYWMAVYCGASQENLRPFIILLHASFFTALGTTLTVFSHGADLDLTSGKSSLPRWLHYLPVRNYLLAVVPMVALIVGLAWAWFPYQLSLLHFFDSASNDKFLESGSIYYAVLLPALFFFAVGFWIQATSWWPFRFAAFRAIAIFAIGYILIRSATEIIKPFRENDDYNSTLEALVAEGSWHLDALAFGSLALGAVAAVFSISMARRRTTLAESEFSGSIGASLTGFANRVHQTMSPDAFSINSRFENNHDALRWRDWKKLGQFPCWVMLCIAVWALLYNVVLALFLVAVLVCGFSGSTLGKNKYWKGSKPFSPFLGTLPVANDTFLYMRFVNAFRVSLVCWGIAGACFLIGLLSSDVRGGIQAFMIFATDLCEIDTKFGINILAVVLLMSFYLTVVAPYPGLAVGLCGRRLVHIATNIVLGALFFISWAGMGLGMVNLQIKLQSPELANNSALTQEFIDSTYSKVFLVLCILLVVKVLFAFVAIGFQVRRGVFAWKPILKFGTVMAVCCTVLVGCFWFLLQGTDVSLRWLIVISVVLLPLGSLLMAPVSLDWNRHR